MADLQISLPLLIVWPSILNPAINFSTRLWSVKWNALGYTFALCIPFHLLQCQCNNAPTWSIMIWSTSYHHVIILVHRSWPHLLFTIASVHRCQVFAQASPPHGPSLQSLQLALHACNRSIKPSHVLIFSTLITWLNVMSHVQWPPSSHVWALKHLRAISPPWHMLLTHMYLWTNHLCISHKHN